MGLKIQQTQFVNANAASAFRTLAVQSPKPPIFEPELRILGILPRLSMTQGAVLYGGKSGQPFGGDAKTVPARAIPHPAGQSRLADL